MDVGTLWRKIKPNRKSIIQDLQYFLLSDVNEINSHFVRFFFCEFCIKKSFSSFYSGHLPSHAPMLIFLSIRGAGNRKSRQRHAWDATETKIPKTCSLSQFTCFAVDSSIQYPQHCVNLMMETVIK